MHFFFFIVAIRQAISKALVAYYQKCEYKTLYMYFTIKWGKIVLEQKLHICDLYPHFWARAINLFNES